MSTSISTYPGFPARAVTPMVAGWKFWLWRPVSQGIARSNARGASIALAERRVERDDVEDFLARWAEARRSPLPHPV